jgi:GNAT superfamily N-acetyltransferase
VAFAIRPARADDVALIAHWTKDTFSWGDYVAERLPVWLEEPDALVIVCVLEDDAPVAVARAELLSPLEAWLSAARVHPAHRRAGMGMAMNDYAVAWARERGARVARLAVETSNRPAIGQVLKSGYRAIGDWVNATAPAATGRRLENDLRLRPGAALDADAAWTFWSQSDLARAARDLISLGWRWRKATDLDLARAVEAHAFLHGPGGWAIVETGEKGTLARWLATTQEDAPLLLQGLRDLQRDAPGQHIEIKAPAIPWMTESLQREGFDLSEIRLFSKTL